jgi:DNA polymerase I
MTTDGPVGVAGLSVGDHVYALDPVSQVIKRKPVTAIRRVPYNGKLVALETQRADLRVALDHRIPFQTKSIPELRFEQAGDLDKRGYYKFVNEWKPVPRKRLKTVDIIEFVDEYEICASIEAHGHSFRAALPDGCEPLRNNGHTGYHFDAKTFKQYQSAIETVADEVTIRTGPNHHRRPYRFDGDDFIEFLGWFITEGSVHWPNTSDTAQVKIAQETDSSRQSIALLFDRMGLDVHSDDRKFEFGSKVFGELLETLCGSGSSNKHLPELVWSLPQEQQRLLLEVLLAGDGNDRQTYYTASDQLASDVLRLCLELGIKPRYTRRDGIWQIYVREVNDGFQPAEHVRKREADENLYRLTIADYSVVMAGRNGKFQWVGVSGIR